MVKRRPKLGQWDDSIRGMRRKPMIHRDGIELTLYRIEPSSLFPAHSHPEAQFAYMVEGSGVQRVGGIVRRVKKGDGWYVPPGAPHEFETDPLGTVVLINVLVAQPDGITPQAAVAQKLLAEAAALSVSDTSYVAPPRGSRARARATVSG
jgi:quercetin dioxygenase-like cupin family protein